jgi:RNA polymerase sigma-70 factor (ECF subfamily)
MSTVPALMTKLRRFLRRHGRTADEADEFIQEAFLRLQSYQRDRQVKEPEAFLIRTVRNLSVDSLRQRQRHRVRFAADIQTALLPDPRPMPDEVLIGQQRLQRVREGLEALAPRTREAILLHRIEGHSHAQIAAHLGISVSAVEKHVAKAMLLLSDWMAGEDE